MLRQCLFILSCVAVVITVLHYGTLQAFALAALVAIVWCGHRYTLAHEYGE